MIIPLGTLPAFGCPVSGTPDVYYVLKAGTPAPIAGTGSVNSLYTGVAYVALAGAETDTLGDLTVIIFDVGFSVIGVVSHQIIGGDLSNLVDLDTTVSSRGTANAGDAMDLDSTALTAINTLLASFLIDAGCTLPNALSTMVAVLTGQEDTVAGVTSFQNWALTKTRVQTSATAGGNRTAPTLDLT